ncbi:MAG: glycosyltransferase [Candidatus Sumerlaea chitinivorans]|nr:glycosyltransferase [Candidatus Sumerlaea chitinivorans]
MIRVALIAHLAEISGSGRALIRMAKGLNPDQFSVVLVVPSAGPLWDLARTEGVAVEIIPNPEVSMREGGVAKILKLVAQRLRYILRLARFLRTWQTSVVLVNSTASIFAGVAARLARKSLIWHVRELLERPDRATRFKMWLIERLSDAIFYASHASMELFQAPRVARRLVVRNYVEVERFRTATMSPEVATELGIAPDDLVITSNGVFPRKAPDLFLEAAAIVAKSTALPLRFLLVGAPPAGLEDYYEQMCMRASKLGIGERVVFAGLRKDMEAILARTDVFVSPSRNEAQPNIINEALAAGVPVVATDVGDCRRMLRDGEWGWVVPPENPQALAQALLEVLSNLEAARARAQKAQEAILREFSSAEFWKPVEDVMRELASAQRSSA